MAGRDRFKVNQWYDVPNKKGKGSKQHQVSKEHDPVIKFFVSNLPERCSSSDLVRVLKVFAEVQGTYIARKYDRLGKRFGFVSFKNVRNLVDLEEQLKDVWIGSYKLFIVPARFVDGVDVSKKKEAVWQPVSKNGIVENNKYADNDKEKRGDQSGSSVFNGNNDGGRTFRDTLINKESVEGLMEIVVDPSVQAFSEWYDYGLVGRVKDFSTLTKLKRFLKLISPYKIDIKYVGGFHVMLLFGNNIEKQRFFESKEEWEEVFCQLQDWKGQDLQVERIVWIKIYGVPVTVSNVQVFDAIAGRFGDVIQSAQFTENDKDLSFAVCGVLCKSVNRIQQTVVLKRKDKVSYVRVEEEAGDWIPDCLVDLDEVGDEVVTNNVMDIGGDEVNISDIIGDEQIQETTVGVQDIHSGAQEVFLNHIQEGGRCGESRKKKGVYTRKKVARSKSKSPLGQERPKKRQRESDDPYDIDRFIFQSNEGSVGNAINKGGDGNAEEFLTPDLNREVVLEEERHTSNSEVIAGDQGAGETLTKRLEDGFQDEMNDTVRMASVVGVTNMENFEGHLEKVIANEGFRTVDQ